MFASNWVSVAANKTREELEEYLYVIVTNEIRKSGRGSVGVLTLM